jgi:ferredoxin
MQVEVERDKCITAGHCVLVAPDVFDQDDDGVVILLDDAPAEALREAVEEAAALCPAALIRLSG